MTRRKVLHQVIFGTDTPLGKLFDVVLLVLIVLSVAAVTLESVESVALQYGELLRIAEWVFTILFSVEYILRLYAVRRPMAYVFSFFGLVDLLALAPTYISLALGGAQSLAVIRAFRLLRIFRILKLARYVGEMDSLARALRATRAKITVFLLVVMTMVMVMGATMYFIEGKEHGFTSIPRGMYWAIVTITTVGYGDIAPGTGVGQVVAAAAMILGYSLIIIPTGIFATELIQAKINPMGTQCCAHCAREGHEVDAAYCKFCGSKL